MGGNQFVVRALGLLILAVIAVGGIGTIAVLMRIDAPQLDVAFVFIPWTAVAIVGMGLLWLGAAMTVFTLTKDDENR